MSGDIVLRAVAAFMARDLDGLLALADPQIVLRSLLTEPERALYHGHGGVRDWFDAVFVRAPRRNGDRRRKRRADRPDVLAGRPGGS